MNAKEQVLAQKIAEIAKTIQSQLIQQELKKLQLNLQYTPRGIQREETVSFR